MLSPTTLQPIIENVALTQPIKTNTNVSEYNTGELWTIFTFVFLTSNVLSKRDICGKKYWYWVLDPIPDRSISINKSLDIAITKKHLWFSASVVHSASESGFSQLSYEEKF